MHLIPKVVYVDDDLLVVDKPSGLLTIPDGHDPNQPYLRAILEPEFGRLWIVHRLDKATSGLVILARNEKAHRHLNAQFFNYQVEKIYRAIVIGVPSWDVIEVEKALRTNVGRRKRTIIDEVRGKPAKTFFRLLTRYNDHALVEARPHTGRTHQIRVHLYSIGHPILADPLYGDSCESQLMERLALHAREITCIHPSLENRIKFKVPEGQDFINTLQVLVI